MGLYLAVRINSIPREVQCQARFKTRRNRHLNRRNRCSIRLHLRQCRQLHHNRSLRLHKRKRRSHRASHSSLPVRRSILLARRWDKRGRRVRAVNLLLRSRVELRDRLVWVRVLVRV